MNILILFFGFLFGGLLVYARLNRFDVISGNAMLKDMTIAKAILMTIGVGALLLNVEIWLGLASYHVKPFIAGGVLLGGIVFGIGMAVLGYCPGTLAVSTGEGSLDALTGIVGGLLGGLVFTVLKPELNPVLGPNWGKLSLFSLTGQHSVLFFVLLLVLAIVFVVAAFALHGYEKKKGFSGLNYRWLYSGIGLAVLNSIVFLKATTNRPIGASTSYPYVADRLAGATQNGYFSKISTPGHWELIFLSGALLAGLVFALLRKDFKFRWVHQRWIDTQGPSAGKRIFWAFVGGFILVFGARMAGGCTSGHIISGGMQLALSSLVFGIFVFASFIVTGKLFYRKP